MHLAATGMNDQLKGERKMELHTATNKARTATRNAEVIKGTQSPRQRIEFMGYVGLRFLMLLRKYLIFFVSVGTERQEIVEPSECFMIISYINHLTSYHLAQYLETVNSQNNKTFWRIFSYQGVLPASSVEMQLMCDP